MIFFILLFQFIYIITSAGYQVTDIPETAVNLNISQKFTIPGNVTTENSSKNSNSSEVKKSNEISAEGGTISVKFPETKVNTNRSELVDDKNKSKNELITPLTIIKLNDTVIKDNISNKDLYEGVPKKNDNKTISARKLSSSAYNEQSFSYTSSTTRNMTSSTTAKPKKPTITVHDESFKELEVKKDVTTANSDFSAASEILKVPTNSNRQKYIVPIVAVILSVPFVAIIISVVYKKGSDWWKYRHYRRMDFLINGMYDT